MLSVLSRGEGMFMGGLFTGIVRWKEGEAGRGRGEAMAMNGGTFTVAHMYIVQCTCFHVHV